jgi:site-specific DNA-methyltransferase (adenine-specific)/adenine-specific DNA-methyltransferase
MALHPEFPKSPHAIRAVSTYEEARQKGIALGLKIVPPAAFDERAVEKGQVLFFEISFIEATPRHDKKKKLEVRIELTDFSVYNSRGAAEAIAASRKNGVCSRDKPTKHRSDWVDYWAVDFDYQSRKEIIRVETEPGSGVFEAQWTGGYLFENEWQSFRTRKDRALELTSTPREYPKPGRCTAAVKVIDIFGDGTRVLVPVVAG